MAKIVVVTKSLNEERNIAAFCDGHSFADAILIADGGSTDRTVEIAKKFDKVAVRNFHLRIKVLGDPAGFMNPEPQHINFLIDWATGEGADWIILDGCDCWPNPRLKRDARCILEETEEPAVHLHRLYIWGTDQYFPKMNTSHSLWAWRPSGIEIRYEEGGEKKSCFDAKMAGVNARLARKIDFPYCCLHYFAPDEETVSKKLARYAAWGHPQVHPLKGIYAPPESLPSWATEEV